MEDVIAKNANKLVIVLCTTQKLKYKTAKKTLFADSLKFPECLFIYIEYENFKPENRIPLHSMPLFMFFYNGERMHIINNSTEGSVASHIIYLQKMIIALEEEKQIQQQELEQKEEKSLTNLKSEKSETSHNDDKILKEKLLQTNEKYKELEQLEKLIELKKLKALQEFSDKEKKSDSDSS